MRKISWLIIVGLISLPGISNSMPKNVSDTVNRKIVETIPGSLKASTDTSKSVVSNMPDNDFVKAWGPVFTGIASVIASFGLGVLILTFQYRQNQVQNRVNEKQFRLLRSKEERDEITKKLNLFYGPFKELRHQSSILYGKFHSSLPREVTEKKPGGKRFRTLRHLLEKKPLTPEADSILEQLLIINNHLLDLIHSQSGMVDKPELQELLGKLSAHIRILRLAKEGKLPGTPELYEDIVFPLAIDGAIESAVRRLQDRYTDLKVDGEAHQKKIKRPKNKTIDYYNINADQYESDTRHLPMNEYFESFLNLIPKGSRILDAGCGVGRDTRFFIEQGYSVLSFDASEKMVQKCREYPHAYCIDLSFEDVAFQEAFDGVWACASLLHLKRNECEQALKKLVKSLKPGGAIFLSLRHPREGHNEDKSGRYYEYYTEDAARKLVATSTQLEIKEIWTAPSKIEKDLGLWINILARRKTDV